MSNLQFDSGPALAVEKPRLRVLCVEDQAICLRMLQSALRHWGCEVEGAENGLAALDLMQAPGKQFDLIITDHNMPVMEGLQFVARLRQLHFPGKICVSTAVQDPELLLQYQALAVDFFLPKPYQLPALLTLITGVAASI